MEYFQSCNYTVLIPMSNFDIKSRFYFCTKVSQFSRITFPWAFLENCRKHNSMFFCSPKEKNGTILSHSFNTSQDFMNLVMSKYLCIFLKTFQIKNGSRYHFHNRVAQTGHIWFFHKSNIITSVKQVSWGRFPVPFKFFKGTFWKRVD